MCAPQTNSLLHIIITSAFNPWFFGSRCRNWDRINCRPRRLRGHYWPGDQRLGCIPPWGRRTLAWPRCESTWWNSWPVLLLRCDWKRLCYRIRRIRVLRKGMLSHWSGRRVLSLPGEFIRISLPLSRSLRNIIKTSLPPFSCKIPLGLPSACSLCPHEYCNRIENILYKRRWIYH